VRPLFLCTLFALAAAPAFAADSPARAFYVAGQYAQAAAAGEAEGDAAGFAVAARAILAQMVQTHPCLECAQHAERDARRAIALDPKLADGHLLLAASLGAQGRIEGILVARAHDYPGQAKTQIDAALAADPGNCFAIAGEGGWNIEVVRIGGETLARWIYGARLDTGMADFAKAFACAPDNPALRYQYALTLSAFDPVRYRGQIEDALTRAATAKPATAFETFLQGRARELLAALKANDPDAFARLVRRDQGYP
jgi:hypothetical protein